MDPGLHNVFNVYMYTGIFPFLEQLSRAEAAMAVLPTSVHFSCSPRTRSLITHPSPTYRIAIALGAGCICRECK